MYWPCSTHQQITSDTSPQSNSTTGFPSNFDELNEFLACPLLPMERDYPDLISFSLPPFQDGSTIHDTDFMHQHATIVGLQG